MLATLALLNEYPQTTRKGNRVCLHQGTGIYTLDALGTAIWTKEAHTASTLIVVAQ